MERLCGCANLTGNIPENLFINCSEVTKFCGTFYGCEKLTGNIPKKLFINCKNVTSFYGTFNECSRTYRRNTRRIVF